MDLNLGLPCYFIDLDLFDGKYNDVRCRDENAKQVEKPSFTRKNKKVT